MSGLTLHGSETFIEGLIGQLWNKGSFELYRKATPALSTNGFSTGTIAIQIIFSQFFFAILKTRYTWETSKLNLK